MEIDISHQEKPGIEHGQAVSLAVEGRLRQGNDKLLAMCRIQGDLAEWMMYDRLRAPRHINCQVVLIAGRAGQSPWDAVKEYVFE